MTGEKDEILRMASQPSAQPWNEIRIPEQPAGAADPITLQATLYPLSQPGRHPAIIFNHGSTGNGRISAAYVLRALNEALTFQQLGFVVVVPMRKGRGSSCGNFVEEQPGISAGAQLAAAVEDLDATVEYLRAQAYIDPARIVVAGQSRGGFLAVVYAGLHPEKIAGVINFSGGWWGERAPDAEFNFSQLSMAGRKAHVPMLWLYAAHDSFYSLAFSDQMFARYRASGGQGTMFEQHELPGDGHFLSSWPEQWRPAVARYLGELNLQETAPLR
jgi:dienelactone hydrolase